MIDPYTPTSKENKEYKQGIIKLVFLLTIFVATFSTIFIPQTSKSKSLKTSTIGKVQPNPKLYCKLKILDKTPSELTACTTAVVKGTKNANLYCLEDFILQANCKEDCYSFLEKAKIAECKREKCKLLAGESKGCVETYVFNALRDANLLGRLP